MSQSKTRIPSPSRSQGPPITPRRRTRRTLSVASPAKSDASGRLTMVVEQFLKTDKFTMSPMKRQSVLPDNTDIDMPKRESWWKRLEGSSRDVLEALDINQMQGDLQLEEYEFEVQKEKQTVQTVPESSDNESVASIVVPQRRLFNQKKQPQGKFSEVMGSRKSLGTTNVEDQDQTIKGVPKNLFNQGQPRNRPVFPAALLNSTNKTLNKTEEPVGNKHGRNLLCQAGTKRKNMFTDFVLSESEEDDSLVQHKVFGFKKKDNKRISLASRNRRMPSLTPSVTTEIDIDDWNLLPSSTMIGNGSGALELTRNISDKEIEQQNEDQDVTLTEANESLKPEAETLNISKNKKNQSLNRTRLSKSNKQDNDFDKTLTNDNITTEKESENNAEFQKSNTNHLCNKTVLSGSHKNKTMETETSVKDSTVANAEIVVNQNQGNGDINEQTTENEILIENRKSELYRETDDKDKSEQEIMFDCVEQDSGKEYSVNNHDIDMAEQDNDKEISNEHEDPEILLKNKSKEDMSFKPIGRSTGFRKSKSVLEGVNIRPTLIPAQESSIASEASRNSSTDGSGWDSHRTTRKTLRQTFGKDFTPRKSLRALVMEQSAKRQTEVYKNTSKVNRTKNKTVFDDVADHDIRDRRVPNHDLSSDQLPDPKSPVPDISTHHVDHPLISKPRVSYHKSIHNINEPDISDQKISSTEKSVNVNRVIDDSGPEISIDASYGQGMSREVLDHEKGKVPEYTDRDSKSRQNITHQDLIRINQELQEEQKKSSAALSKHGNSNQQISEKEKSVQELSNRDSSQEKDDSQQDITAEDSEQEERESQPEVEDEEVESESEPEMEHEESQQGVESEQEEEHEESQQESEVSEQELEIEESQQEMEVESEQELENEESQQEIEVESEQEVENQESREEIEVESEQEVENQESLQEIEVESEQEVENEESQQEIEAESEQELEQLEKSAQEEDLEDSEQEVDSDSEPESENEPSKELVSEISHQESEQKSDRDISDGAVDTDNEGSDQEDTGLNSPNQTSKRLTERVVFDNEMSDQEIPERVSRQIMDNEISDQMSDAEGEQEISASRFSEQADDLNESIGTKKSLLRMQMRRIAQQNMEMREKIREQVLNSLKPKSNIPLSPYYVRRIKKPEPKKLKDKPRKPGMPMGTLGPLPKEFLEDLKYKPPKRYAPKSAPWITKHLYKFLETKLEPKYDYRARVRAEELVKTIHSFTKMVRRRREPAPQHAIDELKREMARLNVVQTHHDFYLFFHEFMPREVRLKVNPHVANKLPVPRNVLEDILQSRRAVP